MLKLHPNAEENFNRQAEELLTELSSEHTDENRTNAPFAPEFHIAASFTQQDMIGDIGFSEIHPAGQTASRAFIHDGAKLGLFGESYKKLARLAEKMQSARELRTVISIKTLEPAIFGWMKARRQAATTASMVDYILRQYDDKIEEWNVWIPIASMILQSDLPIGPIYFRHVTKAVFDSWFQKGREGVEQHGSDADKAAFGAFVEAQSRIQGYAAANITIIGEADRATEVAFEETQKALAILSFYTAAALVAGVVSFCAPLGQENLDTYLFIAVGDGKLSIQEGVMEPSYAPFVLDERAVRLLYESGFGALQELYNKEPKTEFQQSLVDALIVYARHTRAKNLSDKLMYIFTALDSFLLQDQNESIQQSIAQPIAYTVAITPEKRMEFADLVIRAYGLRSRFIHHAKTIEETDVVQEFVLLVWSFWLKLILIHTKFATRADFAKDIKIKSFSG